MNLRRWYWDFRMNSLAALAHAFIAATSPVVGILWRISDWLQANERR